MSVALRLRREGNKNRPFYRIVATDSRARRDGRFIEILGYYDPKSPKGDTKLNIPRADYWISQGAEVSTTVASIVKKEKLKLAKIAATPDIAV